MIVWGGYGDGGLLSTGGAYDPATDTMDAARSVTATFDLNGGTGFYTVAPCRVVDTRVAGPALAANTTRTFAVAGGPCGVPDTAKAVALNVTVANATQAGSLSLHAAGADVSVQGTIDFTPLVTRANNAVVQLGTEGKIAVQCSMPAGSTHFVLDVSGYFK